MIREAFARTLMSLACVVALCALVGCPPHPVPPIGPPDASDAARPPKPATCSDACKHVVALPCPSGKCPTTTTQCMTSCTAVQPNAPGFPGCLLAATDRRAADACDTGK